MSIVLKIQPKILKKDDDNILKIIYLIYLPIYQQLIILVRAKTLTNLHSFLSSWFKML